MLDVDANCNYQYFMPLFYCLLPLGFVSPIIPSGLGTILHAHYSLTLILIYSNLSACTVCFLYTHPIYFMIMTYENLVFFGWQGKLIE